MSEKNDILTEIIKEFNKKVQKVLEELSEKYAEEDLILAASLCSLRLHEGKLASMMGGALGGHSSLPGSQLAYIVSSKLHVQANDLLEHILESTQHQAEGWAEEELEEQLTKENMLDESKKIIMEETI